MSARSGALAGHRIILGVTGSIAAYKSPLILRQLLAADAEVSVIATKASQKFIGKAVFTGLGAHLYESMWEGGGETHVQLSKWASSMLIAPATADCIARLAHGRCDDLLAATALSMETPLLIAPAMHPSMWNNAATKHNVESLSARGVHFLGPIEGPVASGDHGMGRMMEPDKIVTQLSRLFQAESQSLAGKHVVVTAGPTREAIDPVRSITNTSSGKMGYALAAAAINRGARVTLISGPVALQAPDEAQLVKIESAAQLANALSATLGPQLEGADVLIMAAAVSDYRPRSSHTEKLKRTDQELQLALAPNPDILASIGRRRTRLRPVLVGFALETKGGDELIAVGRQKLVNKQVDLIVANQVSKSLGQDENTASLVSAVDCIVLPQMKKTALASQILDWVERRLNEPTSHDTR